MATTTEVFRTITVKELAKLCEASDGVDLIDVRTPVEFREVHSVYAYNVPLDSLAPSDVMTKRRGSVEDPVYVICRSGNRSSKACDSLVQAGYSNIVNVEGGTSAWEAAGLPVVRGQKAMSLERQVRIVAGGMSFLGGVLAIAVHPYWAGLSAFVGAGLMFAGITDTCGMAMLLAKMPWNQVRGGGAEKGATCCAK